MWRGRDRQPPHEESSQQQHGSESRRGSVDAVAHSSGSCPGDIVRVFSRSADAWVEGEVLEVVEGGHVRVMYQLAEGWHRRTLCLDSEDLDILPPEHDPGSQLPKGDGHLTGPPRVSFFCHNPDYRSPYRTDSFDFSWEEMLRRGPYIDEGPRHSRVMRGPGIVDGSLRKGDMVRVLSRSVGKWEEGEVVEVMDGYHVMVMYTNRITGAWSRKILHVSSNHLKAPQYSPDYRGLGTQLCDYAAL
eukprot:gnl/TRDRNA2_/TRDRNA2_177062_c8_seq19.p1 gnl/TRDRNA2_/TRDRNA2_177062_c8~~gnl/TRDRNA2_/TRDRNA2_177062_c8_seq19.p1  ORF type:complete len:244 (+),score=7.42 gnl/TRDRNA2_/TRDRNA2_177062_c8_seq19:50-781(+)